MSRSLYRFLVVAMRRPDFAAEAVPLHLAFVDTLRAQGRIELASPFGDRSGGAYV
jgi:uncharacterized protein YciI